MKLAKFGVLGMTAALVFAACGGTSGGSGGGGGNVLTIGTELPMSGGETANGVPTANGVKLAVQQASIPGWTLKVNVQDDALNGVHDPATGGKNMATLVADPTVIGVVGPFNSGVAQVEIPVSNDAGLLQCSPANTNTGLTYPPTALSYRKNHPDRINYVRLAAPDSIQGPAGADYVYNDLNAHSVYILDDTETFGVGVGDSFQAEFQKLGGQVVKRDSAPKSTTDYTPLFTAVAGMKPAAVYLAGTTPSGMGLALKQGRTVAGFESIPFMGPDGVADLGGADTQGSTINVAGQAAANTYGTVAGIHDIPDAAKFNSDYKAAFGQDPGAYSAIAYACAQVIIAGAKAALAAGKTSLADIREFVRAAATAPGNKVSTVIGDVSFDANGDTKAPYMSFYKVDMTANGGKGGWVWVKQQAFTDPNANATIAPAGSSPLSHESPATPAPPPLPTTRVPPRSNPRRSGGPAMRAMAANLSPRVQSLRTIAIVVVALIASLLLLGIPQFVNAMTLGAIYALIALGYTMVYGIIELINFAHGDVFMVGAFASLWVLTTPLGLPDRPINNPLELAGVLVIVVVPVMLFMGLVNVVIERVAYRPLRHAPRLAPLITAIGVSFMLQNFIQVLFGPSPHPTPQIFPRVDVATIGSFNLLGLEVTGGTIRGLNLTMVVVALVLMALLQAFVGRTRLGRAMRSTAQDREAAELMGVDINQTIAITFFVAAALAGAGGVIYGLYFGSVQFNLGFYTGLKAFTAAVLGGIGNTVGAAVGGFVIAFIEVAAAQLGYNRWSEVAVFTVLILVLVFRPSGLFGQAIGERA